MMSDLGTQEETSKVYRERNIAVALAARLALELGYSVAIHTSDDDPEWPVVFIDLPTGQVSWHIPYDEVLEYFPPLAEMVVNPWDGHSTDEKHLRVMRFASREV